MNTQLFFTTPGVNEYDRQNLKNTVLPYSPNPILRTLGLYSRINSYIAYAVLQYVQVYPNTPHQV